MPEPIPPGHRSPHPRIRSDADCCDDSMEAFMVSPESTRHASTPLAFRLGKAKSVRVGMSRAQSLRGRYPVLLLLYPGDVAVVSPRARHVFRLCFLLALTNCRCGAGAAALCRSASRTFAVGFSFALGRARPRTSHFSRGMTAELVAQVEPVAPIGPTLTAQLESATRAVAR